MIDGRKKDVTAYICEDYFDICSMRNKNRESLYLDGIESIENGILTYTDELIEKTRKVFGVDLKKEIAFYEIDQTADFLIREIIEKNS